MRDARAVPFTASVATQSGGGWLFVNMDPDCESLADYLMPAAKILDPFGLENMRYKWRKWLYFDCNWKVAMEAFNETYHVFTTHPEFNRFGEFKGWARVHWSRPTGAALEEVGDRLKALKLTIRNAPLAQPSDYGKCVFTGAPGVEEILIARAY